MKRAKVLILGGGFAGLACANGLDARRFEVTLIDRKKHFEFLPNIHELLSGVKKPAQLRLALGPAMQAVGHRFLCRNIEAFKPRERRVQLSDGRQLSADYVLVAMGSADATYGVSGVRDNSLGFKSVEQGQAIRKRLQALSRDRENARIVIVGSGLAGVEALGEILRRYRQKPLHITLVEAQKRLLPSNPVAVADYIARQCEDVAVSLELGDPVARLTAKTVCLESGRRLRSALTIWTGGPAPPALLHESGLADSGAWPAVSPALMHGQFSQVFVAGDAAQLDTPISRQAYHALDMGRCAAQNIRRHSNGRALKSFRPSGKPTLLAFGDLSTVLVNGRTAVAGPGLAAAKEAVFSAVMTQLDQRDSRERLAAALERSRTASHRLLWPSISRWSSLRRQSELEVLR